MRPELSELGARSRRMEFMRNFRRLPGADAADLLADPCDRATFERSKLDSQERNRHAEASGPAPRPVPTPVREDPVFASQRADRIQAR